MALAWADCRCEPIFFWRGWTFVVGGEAPPASVARVAEPKPLTPIYGCLEEWWAEPDPSPALDFESLRALVSMFALSFSACGPSSKFIWIDLYRGRLAADEFEVSSLPEILKSDGSPSPCLPEPVVLSLPCPLLSLGCPLPVCGRSMFVSWI